MAKKLRAQIKRAAKQGGKSDGDAAAQEGEEYRYWMDQIAASKALHADFFQRGRKIVKLYRDERPATAPSTQTKHRMNILWSNVSVLQPALYSQDPKPNVSRRFLDKDPVSRMASLIVERNLSTALELFDFSYPMCRVRDDYLLPGRGISWVRFAPVLGMKSQREPVREIRHEDGTVMYRAVADDALIDESKIKEDDDIGKYYETEPVESVLSYGLDVDHVMWDRFLHEPVGDWTKCGWVARSTPMRREDLKKLAPTRYKQVTLNKHFNKTDDETGAMSTSRRQEPDACDVWEIWHKPSKLVIWLTDGLPDKLLKVEQDPLHLTNFFPCPRPMLANSTTDTMIPVADYALYQDQAEQIDTITDRIRLLIKAVRVVGVYNGANESLGQMLDEAEENEMLSVDNWVWFQGSGGIKGNVDWFPLDMVIAVLEQLFSSRAQLRQDLYEVTGMGDIVRGAGDPRATATQEQIKSNFVNLRLTPRQSEMNRLARDTLRMMAEVQCEHYPDEALIEMSGVMESDEFKQSDPEKQKAEILKLNKAIALIKSDKLRTFKIDIETDATVAQDQDKEKQARVEFLTAVAPFLDKASQVAQIAPQFIPIMVKMLDFGVRGFRTGRGLESAIEDFIDTVEKAQAAAAQNPPSQEPSPEDKKAQAQLEQLQVKIQAAQVELQKTQADTAAAAEKNKQAALDLQRKRDQEDAVYKQKMLSLEEEIEFRRLENEKTLEKLDSEIELNRQKILQLEGQRKALEDQGGAADVKQLLGQEPQQPTPEEIEATTATNQAALARARADHADAMVRYAEVQKRNGALGEFGAQLGEMMPHDIGKPTGGPKKPPRTTKLVTHIYDTEPTSPTFNKIVGSKVDEVEMPDEEEPPSEEALPSEEQVEGQNDGTETVA